MKKIIGSLSIVILLLLSIITVFAGSIPEDLLHSDDAQIFFAEVVTYHPNKDNPDIEYSPVKNIKGDIKLGTKQLAYKPITVGDLDIKVGDVYLFTYFDENNPTYIFEVTSYNTKTLKIKNVTGDMWGRFEKYLNQGKYEEAEKERLLKLGQTYEVDKNELKTLPLIDNPINPILVISLIGIVLIGVLAFGIGYMIKKNK